MKKECAACGGTYDTAKGCRCCESRRRRSRAKARAATPEGFSPVQVTTDGEGTLTSIKSRPEPTEEFEPDPNQDVSGVSALLNADGQVIQKWVKTRKRPVSTDDVLAACAEASKNWKAIKVPRVKSWDVMYPDAADTMNVYAYGDPHIGMLAHARETGNNFDLKICTHDLLQSCDLLLQRAPRAGHAMLFISGDLWHAQDDKQTTPRGGNKQDVDGRKAKILETGLATVHQMAERILERHAWVTIAVVPGNHDPDLSLVTAVWLRAMYRNTDRVNVLDNANPYMPFRFGQNFFLMTHGDNRVKPQELGEIMLADYPKQAGACRHRRAFTGHIHHKNVQEFRWGFWESFNSLCARDFWHHHSGYRSSRLVEGITFHRQHGYRSRFVVSKEELES